MGRHLLIPDRHLLIMDVDVMDDLKPSPEAQAVIDAGQGGTGHRYYGGKRTAVPVRRADPPPPTASHGDKVATAAKVFRRANGSVAFKTQAVRRALACTTREAQDAVAEANRRGLISGR